MKKKSLLSFMNRITLGILLLWIGLSSVTAQISEGGTPKSFELTKGLNATSIGIDEISIYPPDIIQLKNEDLQSLDNGTPPRVGVNLDADIGISTAGEWTNLPGGDKLWRLKISSEGATALSVYFDEFNLAPGCKMFLYNENKKHVIGAFTHNNNNYNGTFSTEMVQGDDIYIEYYEPKFIAGESFFHIANIGYYYQELAGLNHYTDESPKAVGASGPCQVNINCSPEGDNWQDEKRGVAQITFLAGGSWYLCSGTLVNNTANDATPYFLTAFHCGAEDASTTELNQWIFKFNYEAVGCANPGSEPAGNSITGCSSVAMGNISGGSDFFLVLLNSTPNAGFQPYYNGWDRNNNTSFTYGVGIHHPSGDIKKISHYNTASRTTSGTSISGSIMPAGSAWRTTWYATDNGYGCTEGGSSGSPLFSGTGLQIGTLSGGSSGCGGSEGSPDYYGRFSYHWDQNGAADNQRLKPWLDPLNTGTTTLPGYDPYASQPPVVDFTASPQTVLQGGSVDFYNLTENSPTSFAWTFENGNPGTSTDINPSGIVYNTVGTHDVTLTASNANGPSTLTKSDYIEVIDPSGSYCDTVSQFCCNPTIYVSTNGYVGGTNEYDCAAIAEYFETYNPYNQITGMRLFLAAANNGTNPDVTFVLWDNENGVPTNQVATANISLASVTNSYNNDGYIDVNFGSTIDLPSGGFYVGFIVPGSPAAGDTLAVITNNEDDNDLNTGYSLYDGTWETYAAWGLSLQNAIFPILCYDGSLLPTVDFVGVPDRVPLGSTVQFTDLSLGAPPTAWAWTFDNGDPASSNQQNPTVTYNNIGVFDVSLTVTNANGNSSLTKTGYIEVYDPNSINAFSLDFEACTNFQVDNFDPWTTYDGDGSGTYGSSTFDFDNESYTGSFIAFNSTATVPEATGWEAHGGNLCGICFAATTPPNDDWLISTQISLGVNSSFTFWAKSIVDTYGLERFKVLVSTTNNQPASFTTISAGTYVEAPLNWTEYTYDLSAYDNQTVYIAIQCVSNDAFAFMIDDIEIYSEYQPPVCDFEADQTSVVVGNTVNFTDLSSNMPTSWSWSFPGGTPNTSTDENPSVTYNTLGTYNVSLTVTNAEGTDSETKTGYITVTEAPDVLVLWDFPNNPDDNIADDGIPENINKTITPFGGVSDVRYSNAGVTTRSIDGETWASGANLKGWMIEFSSLNYGTLKLSFAQMSNNARSPRDFKVQYSIDGTNWTDLGINYALTEDVWYVENDIVLPVECENKANVYIRWLMTSDTGCGGQAVSSAFTTRRNAMDDVWVTGLPLNVPPEADFTASNTEICAGESVTFTDASLNNPISWNWLFEGGTPATSSDQNPVITYSNPGTYQVELTVNNASGSDTETKLAYITVNDNPTVSASNSGPYCVGNNIELFATGSGGDTYDWTGPATFNSNLEDPTRPNAQLTHAGTYNVVITNSATGCSASANTDVVVNPNPTISASNTGAYCVGETIELNATGSGGDSYLWTGPDGFSTGAEDPTIFNAQTINAGTYTIELTNTTTNCYASANTVVAVNANPSLSASNTGPYCVGQTIELTATGSGGTSYSWSGPDGFNNTSQNPTIGNAQITNAGTYTVSLTNTTTGCETIETTTVTVNPNPTITASNTGAYCEGETIELNATGTGGDTFVWSGPNSFSSSDEDPTISNAQTTNSGSYNVVYTNTTTNCSASANTSVTVNANPSLSASNTGPYCVGQTIQLSAIGSGGASYNWSGPDGFSSTSQNPTISNAQIANAGTYTVSLTNTTTGCETIETTTVTVNPNPTVSASNTGAYCGGETIELNATGTGGDIFVWTGPNSFSSSDEDPTISNAQTTNSGSYNVVYTNTTTNCSATANTNLTVNANPSLSASNTGPYCEGETINLSATGSGGTSYNWSGPDGFSSTSQNPTIGSAQITNAGTYTVSLTNTTTGCETIETTTVTVNPNPTISASNTGAYCEGETITLNATGTGGDSYMWTGPNGFSSADEDPTIANAQSSNAGTYNVVLSNSSTGCSANANTIVVVNANPDLSASNTGPYCVGQTIELTATGSGGTSYNWSGPDGFNNTSQNPTIGNAQITNAGTYTVSLTNTTTGCETIETTTVTVNPNPIISASNTGAYCEGETITLNATGTGGDTFAWTGPNTFSSADEDPTIANAQTSNAGTYNVVLSNSTTGCVANASTIVAVNPNPTLNAGSNSPVCEGDELQLSATGSGGNSYSWTGPNSFTSNDEDPVIPNSQTTNSGTYNVVLTNTSTGCNTSASTSAVINPAPIVDLGTSITECPGNTVILDAGAGYSYSWSTGSTSQTITVSTADTYSVTVYNSNGCEAYSSVDVSYYPQTVLTMSSTPESATGANDGTATVSPVGIVPFDYVWSNGGSSSTISGLSGGNYSVTVTDGNNCETIGVVNVSTNNTPPVADFTANTTEICVGETISFTDLSTNSPFAWSWTFDGGTPNSASEQNPIVSYNTPGTFSVSLTVTNVDGFDDIILNSYITVHPNPTVSASNTGEYCAGETIELNASGSGGDSYSWTGPLGFNSNTEDAQRLNALTTHTGIYTVILENTITGCTTSATTNVVVNPNPTISASNTGAYCEGETIELNAIGSGGDTYVWTGPNSFTSSDENPVISNAQTIDGGTYNVVLSNSATGCNANASTIVVVNANPNLSASNTGPYCVGETIELIATGSGGTSYNWSGPDGFTNTSQNPTISSAQIANAGTYTVSLTNTTTGCETVETTIVEVNPNPTISASNTGAYCEGETIELNAIGSGGDTYIWTGPNSFTSSDENPEITNAQTIDGGTYNLVLSNSATGCSANANTIVVVNANPGLSASNTGPYCEGETIELTATGSGGTSYNWSGPDGFTNTSQNPTISNAQIANAGTYTVSLTNTATGCETVETTIVEVNPNPTISASNTGAYCEGETIELNSIGSGGDTYVWTGPNSFTSSEENPVITNAQTNNAGTYNVVLSNSATGCSSNASTIVEVNVNPSVLLSSGEPYCEGETINLYANGSGGNSYEWTGPNSFSDNSQNPVIPNATVSEHAGTYTLTYSNTATGCSVTEDILINVNENPAVSAYTDGPYCIGDEVLLEGNGSGGNEWHWTGPNGFDNNEQSPTISNAQEVNEGTYTLTLTNSATGCTTSTTVYVEINPLPVIDLGADITVCANESVSLSVDPIFSEYFWNGNPGTNSIEVTEEGTYELIVTNSYGCTASSSVNVYFNELPIPIINTTPESGEGINDGTATVSITGGLSPYTIEWNTGSDEATISGLSGGIYSLTVTDDNGCSNTASAAVNTEAMPPVASFSVDNAEGCAPLTVEFTDESYNNPMTWLWDFGDGNASNSENPTYTFNYPGTYTVILTVENLDGSDSEEIEIIVYENPVIDLGDDIESCEGLIVSLTAPNGFVDYLWNPGQNTQSIDVYTGEDGYYEVTVIDEHGCIAVDGVNVTFNENPTIELGEDITTCMFDAISLDAGSGMSEYLWSTGEETQVINVEDENDYSVTVTNEYNCTASDTMHLFVLELPELDLPDTDTACVNEPYTYTLENSYEYILWSDGTTEPTYNMTYIYEGNYNVWVTVGDENCENIDTMIVVVDVCTNIENIIGAQNISIYPNPAKEIAYMNINNVEGEIYYSVIDIQGRVLFNDRLYSDGELSETIDISNYAPGMYYIKIIIEGISYNQKLVVE